MKSKHKKSVGTQWSLFEKFGKDKFKAGLKYDEKDGTNRTRVGHSGHFLKRGKRGIHSRQFLEIIENFH